MIRRLVFIALALGLVAAACGDAATTTTTTVQQTTTTTVAETTTTAAETTTTTAGGAVTFTGADGVEVTITDTSRIVSLNGDITEILFELGVGDQVVARDVTTTYPPETEAIPVIGFGQQLAPEPVLAFEPTLVIGDEFIEPAEAIEQIRSAGIPVVIIPTQTTLEGISTKIDQIATIVGRETEGEALIERVEGEIADAKALAEQAEEQAKVAYVYARGPQVIFLFGAGMPTNAMITGANAVDVGAASGIFGPAPLTPEALAAAAPEVIVLPEAGLGALGGPEAFLAIPGVAETPAGAAGKILAYDEAYFFNLGPRAGQALRDFVLDLYPDLAE